MATLCATPYDISANFFYFDDYETYQEKAKALRNAYGQPVEEFEIQFIDGDDWETELAKHGHLNQANLETYFGLLDSIEEDRDRAGALELLDNMHETLEEIAARPLHELADRIVMEVGDGYTSPEQVYDELGQYMVEATCIFENVPETVQEFFDIRAYGRSFFYNGYSHEKYMGTTYVFSA
jgi:hypothetical protein